ncbi:ThiF family adenylyltransferase [Corynebacterium occultum]|nr:ThiF family adenylyltransferase [Corynebacterium occultum]
MKQSTLSQTELRRIARQLALPGFGLAEQEKLAGAHVLVIGAGGLGCPAMQSLAAVGIGHISVIDDDVVDLSNIHRQILFGAQDEGRPKVEVTEERLRQLQPDITVTPLQFRMTTANAVELFEGVDLVIDGSDTFATKYLSADAAEITGTPLVWGTVLRYRGDVALWWSGPGAPGEGVGLRDLFPEQPDADSVPDCATAGVLGVTTSVVAGLMTTEVVKHLAGIGESLPGEMLSYDALGASLRSFRVGADPGRQRVTELRDDYGAAVCQLPALTPELPAAVELLSSGQAVGLDVREDHEKLVADLPGKLPGLHLPTSVASAATVRGVLEDAAQLSDTVVVYCAAGRRSDDFLATWSGVAEEFGLSLRSLPGGVNGMPKAVLRG